MSNASKKLRLGIIGCGAIAESAHLPAALCCPHVELVALSDLNRTRLDRIERWFGLDGVGFTDYRDTFSRVDAVILAVPNALHASVGGEFLSRGIHVLCEKPLAVTSAECALLCEAASKSRTVLAVGYMTRFYPSTRLTKELIESGFLGPLESFDYEFGTSGGWETLSGYNLARATSGGGVFVVSGSHFLDRILYLFGEADPLRYVDDCRGGVEANCEASFRVHVHGRVLTCAMRLSKTHSLSNRLRIVGEAGALEVGEGQRGSVYFFPADSGQRHEITHLEMGPNRIEPNYFQEHLEDFLAPSKRVLIPG